MLVLYVVLGRILVIILILLHFSGWNSGVFLDFYCVNFWLFLFSSDIVGVVLPFFSHYIDLLLSQLYFCYRRLLLFSS